VRGARRSACVARAAPSVAAVARAELLSLNLLSMDRPIRVLVAKPGLDGHDRGAKVVAAALRDAGMEVVYTGLHQTPEMIATAAVQEDVDVVGLSILSGAHMTLFPRVLELLRQQGRDDVLLTGGGIIPKEDMEELQRRGVGKLFGPGTPTSELIAYIQGWFAAREGAPSRPVNA
jgi:methylmalonyl-CoA mutase C-terminal domain/subunit